MKPAAICYEFVVVVMFDDNSGRMDEVADWTLALSTIAN